MPSGSQQGRNTNEANIVRQGLATAAAEDGATSGQVASVTNGELEFVTAGGGSQPFVRVSLRHSADFANLQGGAPVTTYGTFPETSLTLPPSLFGSDSVIDVIVYNPTDADVNIGSTLVVQSADGTVWIQQDTPSDQTIAAGGNASIDLSANGGSAGAGLSWNAVTKKIDIANAGVYSAFVTLDAVPTP